MQNTILDILALFPADTDFDDLPVFDKLELVRALCDLVLDRMVLDGVVTFEPETLRYHPVGRDSKGRTYWIFGETRLYRQRRMPKSGELEGDDEEEFTFSLANWRRWMTHFAESKKSSNRHLHAALERIGIEVLESIQASELARIREEERLSKLRMMDLMPRKRSNRLEMKTKEMEQLRHEEELRRQAEELEVYKFRQQKEKEEEEKRRQQELLIETAQDLDMHVRDAIRQIESAGQTSLDTQRIHQILPDVPLMMRATRHGRASKPLAAVPTKDSKRKVLTKREDIEAQESKLKDLWSMVIQDCRPIFERKGKGLRGIHVEKDVYDQDISDVSHIIRKHVLRKTIHMLQSLPQAEPFLEPVDPEALHIPDYFKVVKRPMDLVTIHKNIILDTYLTPKSNGETAESNASRSGLFTAVIHDILLIFDNCYLYNPKGSWVDKECRALEKLAGEIFAKTFDVPEKARVNYDEDKEDQELDVTGDSPEHYTPVAHKTKRPAPKPRAPPAPSAKQAHYADKGQTAGDRGPPSQPINFVHYDPNQRYAAPLPYQQPPVIQPSNIVPNSQVATFTTDVYEFVNSEAPSSSGQQGIVVDAGFACQAINATSSSLTTIFLVQLGNCDIGPKMNFVQLAGASSAIVYDNVNMSSDQLSTYSNQALINDNNVNIVAFLVNYTLGSTIKTMILEEKSQAISGGANVSVIAVLYPPKSSLPSAWEFTLAVVIVLLTVSFITSILMHFHLLRLRRRHMRLIQQGLLPPDAEFTRHAWLLARSKQVQTLTNEELKMFPTRIFGAHPTDETDFDEAAEPAREQNVTGEGLNDIPLTRTSTMQSYRSDASRSTTRSRKALANASAVAQQTATTGGPSTHAQYTKGGDEMCVICLDEFEPGDELRKLPCGHEYHCECIDPWLTIKSAVCPLCKHDCSVPATTNTEAAPENSGTEATPMGQQDGTNTSSTRYTVMDSLQSWWYGGALVLTDPLPRTAAPRRPPLAARIALPERMRVHDTNNTELDLGDPANLELGTFSHLDSNAV
ncbi:hypothetical protein BZG36_02153 [Bifiguratus adelaidae]|uniref:RING-type E3 ubiquitin transferase n=1 Tax=Bifiguratus adelaidae TaxID=1938954 RepID=A0A261Y335_9FUNG|nr:hypothetical protein BZG36_02153 [Bifiguratus adelaidae]